MPNHWKFAVAITIATSSTAQARVFSCEIHDAADWFTGYLNKGVMPDHLLRSIKLFTFDESTGFIRYPNGIGSGLAENVLTVIQAGDRSNDLIAVHLDIPKTKSGRAELEILTIRTWESKMPYVFFRGNLAVVTGRCRVSKDPRHR